MAVQLFSSSPKLPCTRHPTPDSTIMSSPPRFSSSQCQEASSGKTKKKPTVTPRTFKRFFTPRSSLSRGKKIGASRQALKDITSSATNRKANFKRGLPGKDAIKLFEDGDIGFEDLQTARKKRIVETPETTPDRSSPLKRIRRQSIGELDHGGSLPEQSRREWNLLSDLEEDLEEVRNHLANLPTPIVRSRYRGQLGGMLRREMNSPYQTSKLSKVNCSGSKLSMDTYVGKLVNVV